MKKKNSLFKILIYIFIIYCVFNAVRGFFKDMQGSSNNDNDNNQVADVDNNKTDYSGGFTNSSTTYSSNWEVENNTQTVNTVVQSGVRDKYTKIIGNNKDTVTIMVYMCASDLETESSMATYDLIEMAGANISDNVKLIVYTGGASKWHNKNVSSKYNQIFRIHGNNQIETLVSNAGTGTMLDVDTLSSFIEYCAENYEANRYELILWDHGGGSVSGYGYDEKYQSVSPLNLSDIDKALTNADIKFDFVGFDACLMANVETALMLSEHADYLIASEESEPGTGWYYTDWINAISKNTSISTVELGKTIVDTFIQDSNKQARGQSATLSVTDLAEVQGKVADKLVAFAKTTTDLINDGQYRIIADARSRAREYGQQAYVDMVDIVDMANRVDTDEAKQLVDAIIKSVKYNNTTSDMSNSYGLSIYFPYRTTYYLNDAVNVFNKIDGCSEYSECIKSFSNYLTSGQVASGGNHYAYDSYNYSDYSSYYSNQSSYDYLEDLFQAFTDGYYSSDSHYSSYYDYGGYSFFRSSPTLINYIIDNHFDADLNFKDGKISLSEKQWSLVTDLRLNMFIDDGEGYIDLGKDNYYEIDEKGNLLALEDITWLAASADNSNWQVIPYYYVSSLVDGDNVISKGRIPVLLNGKYANLIVRIDDDSIEVIGATYDYKGDTDVLSKNLYEINEGDEIEFVCDYYDYDYNYTDSYKLGDTLTVKDKIYLGDVDISEYDTLAAYEITDIYQQKYYTNVMK